MTRKLFLCFTVASMVLLATWIHTAELPSDFASTSINDLYWITFTGDEDSDPVYLMQIDSRGAIKIQPKSVIPAEDFGNEKGSTALGRRTAKLFHLFHWGEDGFLYRAVIKKTGLVASGIKKITAIETEDDDHLQVTQLAKGNFLLAEIPVGKLELVPLSAIGLPAGPGVEVAASAPRENDEASLSADGRLLLSVRQVSGDPTPPKEKLFAVPINLDGTVTSARGQSIASFSDIEAADASNPFPNGNRFVAYIIDDHEDQNGDLEDHLMLQIINAAGKAVGAPDVLNSTRGRAGDDQNVAIDPLGGFVVFTISGDRFNCEDRDVLVYQRLNAVGKTLGKLKLLAGCDLVAANIVNIDILKD